MATSIPFTHEYEFEYAKLEPVSPLIRRVTARNPSGFTFHGTNTYVIGHNNVAVLDPGPLIDEHVSALEALLSGETVTHLLITHTHMDHSPAAAPLKKIWHAPTYGYGPHGSGKQEEGVQIEAGGDMDFSPDHRVNDGDIIQGNGWTVECVYTPGHTSNHVCYALKEEKALFTGDHVMGWSTSVIGPPDGDMTSYMKSLDKLLERDDETYWPAHGTCINDVHRYVNAFIQHRLDREQQILNCLQKNYTTILDMVPVMYTDTDPRMHGAAARSVLAAMIRLIDTGQVTCSTAIPEVDSVYGLAGH